MTDNSADDPQQIIADLQRRLDESIAQQAASSEVLHIISASPGALTPVFEAIAKSAVELCGARFGAVFRMEGDLLHLVTDYNFGAAQRQLLGAMYPMAPNRGHISGRAVLTGSAVHIADIYADQDYKSVEAKKAGFRSLLAVPLLQRGRAIGSIVIYRTEPGPFTARQSALLKAFADQAVIAIENTRLFNETQEALDQQKASADILSVISSSVADTQPVFDKILSSIEHLFGGQNHVIFLAGEDGLLHVGAAHGSDAESTRALFPVPLEGTASEVAIRERRLVRYVDSLNDPDAPPGLRRTAQRLGGDRSVAIAPMLWEDRAIGSILVARRKNPFSDKECALLRTFADQAVIAIENARLFNETKEALERQTATADILRVIASSPSDVQPVFEAIAASANRLIGGFSATVMLFVDDALHLVAFTHTNAAADQALQASFPRPITEFPPFELVRGGGTVEFPDTEAENVPPVNSELARLRGYRSMVFVPLMSNGAPVGILSVTRVRPGAFPTHHVQLLRTFADQAVIAIENARLFEEVQARTRDLQESLQQQTATSEVLRVISSSPGELAPVFGSMLENAVGICDAQFGNLFLVDSDTARWEAGVGTPPKLAEYFTQSKSFRPTRGSHLERVMRTREVSHTADDRAEAVVGAAARLGGARSTVCVPMVKDETLVGAIFIYRTEVRPFTDKQIDLVKNFAAQAVIAIENARLLRELRQRTDDLTEALVYQTGSSNILKVIASSPTDVGPALKAIVDSACEICDAYDAAVMLKDGDDLVLSAHHGPIPFAVERRPISRQWVTGRAVVDKAPQHVHDMLGPEGDDFTQGREVARQQGHRTILSLPLLREGEPIGAILLRRIEVHPFNDKQIELLKSFADQAVIAISNVRLFEEVQQRTRELSKSLDDLRTAQDRLIQTEKLASLGQLTAGIAHEIKNPLNFVNNFSALSAELTDELKDALKPVAMDGKIRGEVDELTGLLKDNLEKVVQHGKRADSIVKNMLLHSREGSGEHRPADINSLLDESLNLAYHGARAEKSEFNITLQRDFDVDAGTIELFPQEITRAFLNLISNGVYAATKRKLEDKEAGFEPILQTTTKNLGTVVEIRFRDNGTGIPAEVQEKIFNPFFTTKPAGEGTGLGLSMTHDIIVKQHGGRIDVASKPGQFTEFTIVLPRKSNLSGKDRGKP